MGGVQRFLEVAGFENTLLLGELAPDAGITIRLKLDTHRHLVGIHLAHRLAAAVELRQNAGQVLDVVAHLMRNHISLREIAGRAETLVQFLEEAGVEIDLAVARAIERAAGGGSITAGGRHLAGEQNQRRLLIGLAGGLENAAPRIFRLGQHRAHESRRLVR
ncbi:hypothetical protein L906_08765 [Agrobacterium sp. TS45]|nr:hypothetical protein L906_08765 [Agrobacterium sp. TS45]